MPDPFDEIGKHVGPVGQAPSVAAPPVFLQIDPLAQAMTHGGASPIIKEGEIIAPPSLNIGMAIKRASAWMKERAQREAQPVLEKNIEMMMRGGPLAEAIARHILKIFAPHPSEVLPPPTIEGTK